jgi:hypothetical protein
LGSGQHRLRRSNVSSSGVGNDPGGPRRYCALHLVHPVECLCGESIRIASTKSPDWVASILICAQILSATSVFDRDAATNTLIDFQWCTGSPRSRSSNRAVESPVLRNRVSTSMSCCRRISSRLVVVGRTSSQPPRPTMPDPHISVPQWRVQARHSARDRGHENWMPSTAPSR